MSKELKTWPDAVMFLYEKIKKMRPLAGDNTSITETAEGIRINSQAAGIGGGAGYNGYFKLSAEGTKIYVKDGIDDESTVAGYTIAGNNRIAVAIANFTVAVSGVVYIKTTWNGSAFVSVLLNASQLPIASNGIDIKLVGEYNFSSGTASIISQRLQGENLITGRIC